jgi:hypothetical protein
MSKLCPHCGQPWSRQRRRPVKILRLRCIPCAERRQRGIEWAAQKRQAALEARTIPYAEWTQEMKDQAERDASALWPE